MIYAIRNGYEQRKAEILERSELRSKDGRRCDMTRYEKMLRENGCFIKDPIRNTDALEKYESENHQYAADLRRCASNKRLQVFKRSVESRFIAMTSGGIMGKKFDTQTCIDLMREKYEIDVEAKEI